MKHEPMDQDPYAGHWSVWTNLAYVLQGLIVFPVAGFVAGGSVVLGVSSGVYHATGAKHWQKADIYSIFLVYAALIFHLSGMGWGWTIPVVAMGIASDYYGWVHRWAYIGFLGAVVLLLFAMDHPPGSVTGVVIVYALAMASHQAGELIGGWWHGFLHGIWHVLTAFGNVILIYGW